MTIVLGITNTQDSGACILKDGKIIAAINEERFNREKLTQKFPINSIEWVLKKHKIKKSSIDAIGIGIWKGMSEEFLPKYVKEIFERKEIGKILQDRFEGSVKSDQKKKQELFHGLKKMNLDNIPLFWCDHHLAHAYSAFLFSPFSQALTITFDARGDFLSGSVTSWKRDKEPKIIHQDSEFNSLGVFYGWITDFLGFVPFRHEGKVTGLAAHGDPKKCLNIIKQMIDFKDGKIVGNIGENYSPYVKARLPKLRKKLEKFSKEEVAAATQYWLEKIVVKFATHYLKKTNQKNLCLAGGLFANVLVNMKLNEIKHVKEIFVFPHMGDGGIAAGGGAYAAQMLGDKVKPINNVYFGPSFSKYEIQKIVKNANVSFRKPKNFSKEVAKLLNQGSIIGVFQGRMEYGPRALGNRSILVQTTNDSVNVSLNKRLHRTEFMPFAPITLEIFAKKCYKNWKYDPTSYYMTCCFHCTDFMKKKSPAVVHIDGTARPQIVNKKNNESLHKILTQYYNMTGIPSLINTSFNVHEEPIVCTPNDAIKVLKQGGIDILAIEPYIIES